MDWIRRVKLFNRKPTILCPNIFVIKESGILLAQLYWGVIGLSLVLFSTKINANLG